MFFLRAAVPLMLLMGNRALELQDSGNNCALALEKEYYTLSDYCARSSSDAAPVINNLLKKGDVYVPSGEWRLSTSIILPPGRRLFGDGKDKSVFWATEPLRMVEIVGDDNVIRDLYFRGSNITNKASYLVFKDKGTKRMRILDCGFEGATGGVFVDALCDSIYIYGCQFYKMYPCAESSSSGYGIVLNHNDNARERGTFGGIIEKNQFHETVYRHALYMQSCERIIVRNNVFLGKNEKKQTGFEYHINIRGCKDLLLERNLCRGGYGFINGVNSAYHGRGTGFIIRENVFLENTSSENNLGIVNIRFNNVQVIDNYFIDFNTTAVYVANVDNVIVERNIFYSKYGGGCSVIDITEKRLLSFSFSNNLLFWAPAEMPAVRILKSSIRELKIEGNSIIGGGAGIQVQNTKMADVSISNNSDDGELCIYQNNSVSKAIRYENNRSSSPHPIIKSRQAKVIVSNNR